MFLIAQYIASRGIVSIDAMVDDGLVDAGGDISRPDMKMGYKLERLYFQQPVTVVDPLDAGTVATPTDCLVRDRGVRLPPYQGE